MTIVSYFKKLNLLLFTILFLFIELPDAGADAFFTQEDMIPAQYDVSAFANVDELQAYWFLTCYDLIVENKGYGGIVILDEEFQFLSGYLSPGTPSWFLESPPLSTMAVPYAVPTSVAMRMLSVFDDETLISPLLGYDPKGEKAVCMINVVKLYEPVTLENKAYSMVRDRLDKTIGAQGLEKDDFYAIWSSAGYDEADLVNMLLSGEVTFSDLTLEAIRMMKAASAEENTLQKLLPVLVSILLVIFVILVIIASFALLSSRKRGEKSGNMPETGFDNKGQPVENNSDNKEKKQ